MDLLRPTAFDRPKPISKVAIIKNKRATIAFSLFSSFPGKRLTMVPCMVFHCRPCLNMVGNGVAVLCDHGVLSAFDHGTLPTMVTK